MSGTSCPGSAEAADESARFIPYVTPLKGENPVSVDKVVARPDGRGVMYADETPEDRDRHGALWVRTSPPSDGRPIPLYRMVHPRRAGEAMLDLRCQGCFGEPDRNGAGVLFFVKPDPNSHDLRYWPQTEYTHHPPVCLPCARQALSRCPFVHEAPALRVRNPRPWGVDGLGYRLDGAGAPRVVEDIDRCSYDDLRLLPWMLALQPIVRLSRCTVVDVHAELAAAGLESPGATPARCSGAGDGRSPVPLPPPA